jgi:hypothetical protein
MDAPYTYNADCTDCLLGATHDAAKHAYSVRWTQALARDLDLGRKAPPDSGRTSRYTRQIFRAAGA